MVIMFKTFLAEIITTEEASNARDGVIMVIVYQVHVDTRIHSPSSKQVCPKASISLSNNNALIESFTSSSILTLALCSVFAPNVCNNDSSCSLTNVSSYCVFTWNSLYLTANESCNPSVRQSPLIRRRW